MLISCNHCKGSGICNHSTHIIGDILQGGRQYNWRHSACCGKGIESPEAYDGNNYPICSYCHGTGKVAVTAVRGVSELIAPELIGQLKQAIVAELRHESPYQYHQTQQPKMINTTERWS